MTEFTLKTYPQTQVWGGLITYTSGSISALQTAVSNFVTNNTDPKAAIIAEFNTLIGIVSSADISFQMNTLICFRI